MADWGYVAVGFGVSAATVALYVVRVERRIAEIRARLRAGARR